MKTLRILLISILGFVLIESSYAQGKLALEAKIGTGSTQIDYVGDSPELVVSTSDHVFFGLGLVKTFENGWSYGLESEYYRLDLFFSYTPLDEIKNKGGMRSDYWAFGPKIQKDFHVLPKMGFSLATGLHLTYNSTEDYQFQGGELQSVRQPGGEPRVPVKIYGLRSVEEFTFLVKPEIGVFCDINKHSRIMLSGKWGLGLREPSIVIDLDRIEFEEQTYQNKYSFSGNYFSALLGYRYSF
ncbi:hypothetical protein U3A58_17895 [Algoriphagus sp. C2-6-M1]|uniref:hypothetical protein n=1 Tax=Algoriphagus persicinus TaxID=3108754 RepID=UPI002B38A390|nr:hypothetical protein [Algoriphagus sp. C2-6-M1]MEB2782269.1 hypothetical protein [Algoriphagus sp. C2-6-M1]